MNNRNYAKDALLGLSVGDALGVPVEFVDRTKLAENLVTEMRGYGTHNQLPGTWSDDTSLALCLAEMLCGNYDLKSLAGQFINWKRHAYYSARGYVFDIGVATADAIQNLQDGCVPELAGGVTEYSNGNGSLMRILPLAFYIKDKPINERFECVKGVSSLTHRHIRSVVTCFIYIEYALQLLSGKDKHEAYRLMRTVVNTFLTENEVATAHEIKKFSRILEEEADALANLGVADISSSGYVVSTLEASLWCILTTDNYKDAVLKAVNLGDDTDTTGSVTGGLAGIIYGCEQIPAAWLEILAQRETIETLSDRLNERMKQTWI